METSVENVFASKSKGTEDAFVARNGYCNCKLRMVVDVNFWR